MDTRGVKDPLFVIPVSDSGRIYQSFLYGVSESSRQGRCSSPRQREAALTRVNENCDPGKPLLAHHTISLSLSVR